MDSPRTNILSVPVRAVSSPGEGGGRTEDAAWWAVWCRRSKLLAFQEFHEVERLVHDPRTDREAIRTSFHLVVRASHTGVFGPAVRPP